MSPSTIMPALPTADLRKEGKAYRRDKNHAVKWARGARAAPGAGRSCPHDLSTTTHSCNDCASRPMNIRNETKHFFQRAERASVHANMASNKQGGVARKVLQNDVHDITHSDTGSSDEEVAHYNEASVPDEFMYSYDARSGPSDGADVLSTAVMQAVKRFENKQTEQLVKTEYAVLDAKELEDAYAGDAEDDFELIEQDEYLH